VLAVATLHAGSAWALGTRIVVAWDDPDQSASFVAAIDANPPFDFATPDLAVDPDGRVRTAFGKVLHLSRATGALSVIDPATWRIEEAIQLRAEAEPRDLAIAGARTAYVTRRNSAALLRVDLDTGQTTEATDLSPLGVGSPDLVMETLLLHEGRLYVQLSAPLGSLDPSFVAVIDVATEQIIDADPVEPGIQAVLLQGTQPRFKMQIVPTTRQLMVSATGAFQDFGGFELIDIDALESLGVVVREFIDVTGNDLGAFAMITDDRGWLVYSTDIVLSSHLHPFTITAGEGFPEAATSLFYFAPHIVYDPATDTLFWPEPNGVQAFDGTTGIARQASPTPLSGAPTDLALLPATVAVPSMSRIGVVVLATSLAMGCLSTRRLRSPTRSLRTACSPRGSR
jgi:hypothetical protein